MVSAYCLVQHVRFVHRFFAHFRSTTKEYSSSKTRSFSNRNQPCPSSLSPPRKAVRHQIHAPHYRAARKISVSFHHKLLHLVLGSNETASDLREAYLPVSNYESFTSSLSRRAFYSREKRDHVYWALWRR